MSRLSCLVAISAFAAACGSDMTTPPTEAQYDDTAQQIGSTTSTGNGGGEIGSMADVIVLSHGTLIPGFTLDANGRVSGTHLGLTYSYALTCKDVSGAVLASCTAFTDSASIMVDWSGTLTLPNLTASVARSGDWQLAGLLTDTAQLDGSGTFTLDATVTSIFRPVTAMYHLAANATYHRVLVDTATRRPIGGEITYDLSASDMTTNTSTGNGASARFDLTAVVTFAASGPATLVLDGSHKYSIDTATGVVVKLD